MYEAIRRIQELEKQVSDLTKRAEEAESGLVLARKCRKDAEFELKLRNIEIKALSNSGSYRPQLEQFAYSRRFDDWTTDRNFAAVDEYATNYVTREYKEYLGEQVFTHYLQDLTLDKTYDHRDRVFVYQMRAGLKVYK